MKPKVFKSLETVQPKNSRAPRRNYYSDQMSIDFTFNTIKSVKKVSWKESAPWYREIHDGFCWLAYCNNNSMLKDTYLKSEMRARHGPNGPNNISIHEFTVKYKSELQTTFPASCPAYN